MAAELVPVVVFEGFSVYASLLPDLFSALEVDVSEQNGPSLRPPRLPFLPHHTYHMVSVEEARGLDHIETSSLLLLYC
jgi:hypothetical protein